MSTQTRYSGQTSTPKQDLKVSFSDIVIKREFNTETPSGRQSALAEIPRRQLMADNMDILKRLTRIGVPQEVWRKTEISNQSVTLRPLNNVQVRFSQSTSTYNGSGPRD